MASSTTRRALLGGTAALAAALAAGAGLAAPERKRGQRTMSTSVTPRAPAARKVERVLRASTEHWVGDGFRVKSVISPGGDPRLQSPFLLLDHAAARRFEPAAQRRGVGEHPHRGFETVTFAYKGEIEHRDSAGGGGTIGPGDVQWMTAAGGIVHEEMHSRRFTQEGGDMEMVQLWVNLPARHKRKQPGYQALLDKDFPRLQLGAARARLIAGALGGEQGPAFTHTPMTVLDLSFGEDGDAQLELPSGFTALLFSLEGELRSAEQAQSLTAGTLATLGRGDSGLIKLQGARGARALVLAGEPIDEPVAAYGPFVMNTEAEIVEAIRDYQSGKMGHLG